MTFKYAVTGSAKPLIDSEKQYLDLKSELNKLGMLETNLESCDYLIFINYNKKFYKKYKKSGKNLNKLVLIRLEPVAIHPLQYKKSIERKFGLIIDPGGIIKSNLQSSFIGWPYKVNLNPSSPKVDDPKFDFALKNAIESNFFDYNNWDKRKNKLVLIAANKVSATSNSNYKLRRLIAKQMSSKEIDIYGGLWDSTIRTKVFHRLSVGLYSIRIGYFPNLSALYGSLFTKYRNTLGEPRNKHSIIQQYKYSLVIENSSDYCSEKIFDAILNGSIPIYIGPKSTKIFLPNNLFYSSNGSVDGIRVILNSIQRKTANDMLDSMRSFLQSNNFTENWSSEGVYKKIATKIDIFWSTK
jgi:hypothetical protein